jgi:5-methyltetrahydropteroyltriglutamate--homocysteine methyltransferase
MPQVYRADHVGSLLRPAEVQSARAAFAQGSLDRDGLREVEDQAILNALRRQWSLGLDVCTDGEFRRNGFQDDLPEAVEGFVTTDQPAAVRVWQGPEGESREQSLRRVVGGKLRQARGLTENQLDFLKANAPGAFKITVPSPNQYPAISFQPGLTDQFYATRSELLWDIVAIIKAEIESLVEAGVPYIQLDAPRYSYYVDPRWRQHLRDLGEDPDAMFEEAIAADNACIEHAQRNGATVAIHICRGNSESRWYAEGGYEPIAERLFGSLTVDRFLLEYDTDRAGTFEPLRFVPLGKVAVLGLVSSKEPRLEDRERLLDRIDEACQFIPVDYLALSPQCGFASTAAGNLLTEEQQWRKLRLVVETGYEVWGW